MTNEPGAPAVFPSSRGRLLKILGVGFGIAVAVGNTIAAGIVRTPGDIAAVLPNVWLFLGVWVGGALYALLGAAQLAELGAAIPRSGGQYNYARRALGEYAGFIVGWSDWLSTCGTNAAVGLVIGEYSGDLLPALYAHGKAIAVFVIVLFALLQYGSLRVGSHIQNVTSLLKAVAFLAVVAGCFVIGHGGWSTGQALRLPEGWKLFAGFVLGLQATIYTFDGWDGVIYFGDEVREPGRNVSRAIYGSVVSILGIYLLLNAAVVFVLPMNEIAGNNFALGAAAQRVFGAHGDTIIRSVMVLSLLSSLNALHLMGTRIVYAMSRDGLFFRPVARVNKGGTPTLALLLSAGVGVIFAAFKDSFESVIAMLAFFFVTNYTLSFASLFVLRRREPQLTRPYRAWGYPWTTGAALVGSVLFLAGAIKSDTANSRLTLIALAASYPVYRALKWAAQRTARNAA